MSDLIGGLEAFEAELVSLIKELRREKLDEISFTPLDGDTPAALEDSQRFVLR
jgi:hypothetical protein